MIRSLRLAVVYSYRDAAFVGGGVRYTVNAGAEPIVKLVPGGYYGYLAEPVETEFSAKTEATSSITVDLEPGETYYLKGDVGVGLLVGRPELTLVNPLQGAGEIRACKLLERAQP
jgi:hypothetical protein